MATRSPKRNRGKTVRARYKRYRETLAAIQNNRCYYCSTKLKVDGGYKAPTLEHLKRRVDGGKDHIDNLVVACELCNSTRGTRSPELWKKISKYHKIRTYITGFAKRNIKNFYIRKYICRYTDKWWFSIYKLYK